MLFHFFLLIQQLYKNIHRNHQIRSDKKLIIIKPNDNNINGFVTERLKH